VIVFSVSFLMADNLRPQPERARSVQLTDLLLCTFPGVQNCTRGRPPSGQDRRGYAVISRTHHFPTLADLVMMPRGRVVLRLRGLDVLVQVPDKVGHIL